MFWDYLVSPTLIKMMLAGNRKWLKRFNRDQHQSSIPEDDLPQGDAMYAMVRALDNIITSTKLHPTLTTPTK